MKKFLKTIYIAAIAVAVLAAAGCSTKGGDDPKAAVGTKIVGEWRLSSWSDSYKENMEVYVSFSGSSFTLYQRLQYVYFVKYSGTYTVTDGVLSGVYSDTRPWGASYTVEFSDGDSVMTLTNFEVPDDVTVYTKTTIPSDVKGAVSATISRSGDEEEVRFF